MCIATAGLVAQGAGTGLQAGGAYQTATAQNLAARYNSEMMMRNAELMEIKATEATRIGNQQIAAWKRSVRQLRGQQKAVAAASGVSVYSGSMIQTEARTQLAGDIGAEKLRVNAAKQAWSLRMQAAMYAAEARMARARTVNSGMAMAGPLLSGIGSMLGSAYTAGNEMNYLFGSSTVPKLADAGTGGVDYNSNSLFGGGLSGSIA